ncbi:hypothetical protein ACRALDRAFT_1065741 [Sodiomyces alcalophilus JCM 7366]|uniref:uncharacterized protein n=1 Tax=Sodiomyces alcalophilus JCM 7366 TaxID=591952 RepID=UPI0039B674F9
MPPPTVILFLLRGNGTRRLLLRGLTMSASSGSSLEGYISPLCHLTWNQGFSNFADGKGIIPDETATRRFRSRTGIKKNHVGMRSSLEPSWKVLYRLWRRGLTIGRLGCN